MGNEKETILSICVEGCKRARVKNIMVSDKMRRVMRKNKLDAGIEFLKVPYTEKVKKPVE